MLYARLPPRADRRTKKGFQAAGSGSNYLGIRMCRLQYVAGTSTGGRERKPATSSQVDLRSCWSEEMTKSHGTDPRIPSFPDAFNFFNEAWAGDLQGSVALGELGIVVVWNVERVPQQSNVCIL